MRFGGQIWIGIDDSHSFKPFSPKSTETLAVDQVIFWTDSENVWFWVRNHNWKFKPFVANHIAIIQRTTSSEQWKYVPGKQNPVDLATRGQSVFEQAKSTF